MAGTRDIRRLAFQALFQIDAQSTPAGPSSASGSHAPAAPDADPVGPMLDEWATTAEHGSDLSPAQITQALALARGAWGDRARSDTAIGALAPAWPVHRQAAVDRAILRLAHFEMHQPAAQPKSVVNDAVELAKEFSNDRSPAFVNGILDKVLKQVLAARAG